MYHCKIFIFVFTNQSLWFGILEIFKKIKFTNYSLNFKIKSLNFYKDGYISKPLIAFNND